MEEEYKNEEYEEENEIEKLELLIAKSIKILNELEEQIDEEGIEEIKNLLQ